MKVLGMHRIFGHRNFLPENGPKVHFRFSAEILLSPKQYGRNDANRNRDLHVLVWSNMSAMWTYFSLSEKDPRTAICKTCNAEISRGGASAKTFSTSGLIHHLKSKHFDRYAEYERNARGTEKGVDVTYGLWQALFWYTIMLKAYRENIVVSLSSCTFL